MPRGFQTPGNNGFNGNKGKTYPEVQVTMTKGKKKRKEAREEETNEEIEEGRKRKGGSKGTRREGM